MALNPVVYTEKVSHGAVVEAWFSGIWIFIRGPVAWAG